MTSYKKEFRNPLRNIKGLYADLHGFTCIDFSQTEFGIKFIDKGLRMTKINFLLSCLVVAISRIQQK